MRLCLGFSFQFESMSTLAESKGPGAAAETVRCTCGGRPDLAASCLATAAFSAALQSLLSRTAPTAVSAIAGASLVLHDCLLLPCRPALLRAIDHKAAASILDLVREYPEHPLICSRALAILSASWDLRLTAPPAAAAHVVASILRRHAGNENVAVEGCLAATLIAQVARLSNELVAEGVVPVILAILEEHADSPSVLDSALQPLRALAPVAEVALQLLLAKAVPRMVAILHRHAGEQDTATSAVGVLMCLSSHSFGRDQVAEAGGGQLAVDLLKQFPGSVHACIEACGTISNIAVDADYVRPLVVAGAIPALLSAARLKGADEVLVAQHVTAALWQLSVKPPPLYSAPQEVLDAGGLDLIADLLAAHCTDRLVTIQSCGLVARLLQQPRLPEEAVETLINTFIPAVVRAASSAESNPTAVGCACAAMKELALLSSRSSKAAAAKGAAASSGSSSAAFAVISGAGSAAPASTSEAAAARAAAAAEPECAAGPQHFAPALVKAGAARVLASVLRKMPEGGVVAGAADLALYALALSPACRLRLADGAVLETIIDAYLPRMGIPNETAQFCSFIGNIAQEVGTVRSLARSSAAVCCAMALQDHRDSRAAVVAALNALRWLGCTRRLWQPDTCDGGSAVAAPAAAAASGTAIASAGPASATASASSAKGASAAPAKASSELPKHPCGDAIRLRCLDTAAKATLASTSAAAISKPQFVELRVAAAGAAAELLLYAAAAKAGTATVPRHDDAEPAIVSMKSVKLADALRTLPDLSAPVQALWRSTESAEVGAACQLFAGLVAAGKAEAALAAAAPEQLRRILQARCSSTETLVAALFAVQTIVSFALAADAPAKRVQLLEAGVGDAVAAVLRLRGRSDAEASSSIAAAANEALVALGLSTST